MVASRHFPIRRRLYALLARLETYHVQLLEFRRCHGAIAEIAT
jgi:hypothetical protein